MADAPSLPALGRLNGLEAAEFQAALAPLFEGAPGFVGRLAAHRPYGSWEELLECAAAMAMAMPEEEQLALIDSHPRIGAAPGMVSAISQREQGYDRDHSTAELQARLDDLNDAYERRFGFRFVVFVAGRSRADIVPLMEQSLAADREHEKRRALADICAIARDRLSKLGANQEGP